METWDGEDLYWPAGSRFYVDDDKIEREDEEKWSVMRLPVIVDVKINEEYSRVKVESTNNSIGPEEQNGEKHERDEEEGGDKESNIDSSPTKKRRVQVMLMLQ